jgi:hypothetical protein
MVTVLQESTIIEQCALVCFCGSIRIWPRIFIKTCILFMARIVRHIRLFATGLRNLHINLQNLKTMTDGVAQ